MIETSTDDIIERIREIDGKLVLLDVDLADLRISLIGSRCSMMQSTRSGQRLH
jgi:hypothetical protein